MHAVVQRSFAARVEVSGEIVGSITRGLVAFVGAERGDGDEDIRWIAQKITGLRVFPDETGKMPRALADIGGELPCDVAAYFETRCAECHGEKQTGGAPMPLDHRQDFFAKAPSDAAKTVAELVPVRLRDDKRPMPEPGFVGRPRATQAELDLVDKWIAAGMPKRADGEVCASGNGGAGVAGGAGSGGVAAAGPSGAGGSEYIFFVDVEGHMEEERVNRAIEEIKSRCLFMKILGSYPAHS